MLLRSKGPTYSEVGVGLRVKRARVQVFNAHKFLYIEFNDKPTPTPAGTKLHSYPHLAKFLSAGTCVICHF